MTNWELYERLLNMGTPANNSTRDRAIGSSLDGFMRGIVDDPAYQENATVEGVVTPLVVTRQSTLACQIKAAPGTSLHIGDLVWCYGEHWLVVELYTDKIGLLNGVIWLCNMMIRFQNATPVVNKRFCVVDDGTYSKKSSDPEAYVMNNTYKVYLSRDSTTKYLFIDKRLGLGTVFNSEGKEIIEAYKIIGIDNRSQNAGEGSHLAILTLQRDVFNPATDNVELNICDYIANAEPTSHPPDDGNCTISGRDVIRIGSKRRYTATFYNADGIQPDSVVAVWEVSSPAGISKSTVGNVCEISVPMDEELIGSSVTIRLSDKSGVYGTCEKKVQVITIG